MLISCLLRDFLILDRWELGQYVSTNYRSNSDSSHGCVHLTASLMRLILWHLCVCVLPAPSPSCSYLCCMLAAGVLSCGAVTSQFCEENITALSFSESGSIDPSNILTGFNHTHTVSTFSQLQAALSDGSVSSVIDIQADIIVPEQLYITKHTTLLSSTGSQLSGNHTNRILVIEGSIQVAAYGIVFRDGKPRATGHSRRRNAAGSRHGGAVFVDSGANFTAYNCLFVNNHANRGGAVHVSYHSTFYAEQSVFSANSAYSYGGAVDADGYSTFVCIGCLLVDNKADDNYAAIYADTRLKLRDTHLSNNSVTFNPSGASLYVPDHTDDHTRVAAISCTADPVSNIRVHNIQRPNCPVAPAAINRY